MKLIKILKAPRPVDSVAVHDNKIYIGCCEGSLMRAEGITGDSSPYEFVSACAGYVSSVQVYNNELYVLSANANMVYVYGLDKQLKRSWSRTPSSGKISYNKLRVVNGKICVPSGDAIMVYTCQGELVKEIHCPSTISWKALAVCGYDSVVLSDYGADSVSRINIDSGEVMWVSNRVTRPQGVVCFKNRYVLVTNYGSETRIWILDINTGESDIFCHLDFRLFWKIMSLKKYTSTAGVSFKFSQNSSRN